MYIFNELRLIIIIISLFGNIKREKRQSDMGVLQCGWVGHNAFGPTNNWPVCSLT